MPVNGRDGEIVMMVGCECNGFTISVAGRNCCSDWSVYISRQCILAEVFTEDSSEWSAYKSCMLMVDRMRVSQWIGHYEWNVYMSVDGRYGEIFTVD